MLETLKNQIEAVLQDDPATRNSDIGLLIGIWTRFYGVKMAVSVQQLYDLPREDTVKRFRAKFQNEELKYLPTELKIALRRGILENEWRKAMGYEPKITNYITNNMDTEEKTATVPVDKESNVIIRCSKCGGNMRKSFYHNEFRGKPIEIIKCLNCSHEL